MCVKYLWIKFKILIYYFWKFGNGISLSLYHCVWRDTMSNMWNISYNLKIIHVRTLFIDLHRIRSIFHSTSIGSNNLLFYMEASWRSGAGLWLGNESLVWLSAANQIHLTKYVCPSINLFTCLSVKQPVHPPACPLVYCQSMSVFLSVLLALCQIVYLSII